MNKHDQTTTAIILAAGLAGLSALPAAAQTAPPEPADDRRWTAGETVVVTGQRRPGYAAADTSTGTRTPTPLEEVPQSIQVLTASLIDDQNLNALSDALANVSNVVPATNFEAVTRDTIIRGFDTATYFDGLPAYGLTAVTNPNSLVNVARIEVAKGPSATLFGGAIGAPLSGLINIVSKTPQPGFAASAALELGSFDAAGFEFDLNAPVQGDRVLFRVTGDAAKAGSHIAVLESQSWSLNPSVALVLSDRTRVTLRGQFSNLEQMEYSGLPASMAFNSALGVDTEGFTGAADTPKTSIENRLYTASLDHEFSDALSGNLAVRHYDSRFDEYSTTPFLVFPQPTPTSASFVSAYLPTDVKQTFATASLLWSVSTGPVRHRVLAGIDADQSDYGAQLGFAPLGRLDYRTQQRTVFVLPVLSDTQTDDLSSVAVFVQNQMKFGERLDITAGLRWSRLDVSSFYESGGVTFVDSDTADERVTPRLGATFKLADGLSLFAGWSEGFQGVVAPFGVADPKPEESQAYDGGVKFATPVPGLTGTVSAYQVTRQNVVTADPANPFASIQTGEQRSRGAEIDLIYEPSRSLSVLFSWGWNDTEITRDTTFAVGARPARVPEQSGRLAARYRFGDGSLQGLELGGGLTHVGERFITLPNALKAKAFTTLDIQVSYPVGPATLAVSVTNLTDSNHFEPYAYLNQAVVIPARPRAFSLSLRASF